jgi:hypothetical protein
MSWRRSQLTTVSGARQTASSHEKIANAIEIDAHELGEEMAHSRDKATRRLVPQIQRASDVNRNSEAKPRGAVIKFCRILLVMAALASMGGGVAEADPVGLPEVARTAPDDGSGWRLTVLLTDININAVANMAATPFTREGFVTVKARLTIDGGGPGSPDVQEGKLQVWYQLGCQIDISEGGQITSDPHSLQDLHGGINNAGSADARAAATGSADPGFQVNLNPGAISDERKGKTSLGEMRFPEIDPSSGAVEPLTKDDVDHLRKLKEGGQLVREMNVQDFHVQQDNCAGTVFIRLHARASMSTWKADNDVDVYSDILPL